MPSLLPTPEPADPVEGQPGHFEHSNWLKASVKALDAGVGILTVSLGGFKIASGVTKFGDYVMGLTSLTGDIVFPAGLFSAPPAFVANLDNAFNEVYWPVAFRTVTAERATVSASGAAAPGPAEATLRWIAIGV